MTKKQRSTVKWHTDAGWLHIGFLDDGGIAVVIGSVHPDGPHMAGYQAGYVRQDGSATFRKIGMRNDLNAAMQAAPPFTSPVEAA
jgi:hypothetical protein